MTYPTSAPWRPATLRALSRTRQSRARVLHLGRPSARLARRSPFSVACYLFWQHLDLAGGKGRRWGRRRWPMASRCCRRAGAAGQLQLGPVTRRGGGAVRRGRLNKEVSALPPLSPSPSLRPSDAGVEDRGWGDSERKRGRERREGEESGSATDFRMGRGERMVPSIDQAFLCCCWGAGVGGGCVGCRVHHAY